MLSPGQADKLLSHLDNLRKDSNRNSGDIAQEIFLLRKVLEIAFLLTPEQRAEFSSFATSRAAPPQPAAHTPTQAEIDEINRALLSNELELGEHGLPARQSPQLPPANHNPRFRGQG